MTVNQLKRELEIVKRALNVQEDKFQIHDVVCSAADQAVIDEGVNIILKYRQQGKTRVSNGRWVIDGLTVEDEFVLDEVVRIFSDPSNRVNLHERR